MCVMGVSACALLGDESGEKSLTWEEAKTATQATELEIAELVPDAYVASIVQKPTGTLFSCDDGQHTWYGSTTIALTPDADAEQIVKTLESHFREDDRFDVRNRRDVVDEYEIQLMSPGSAETYVIGPDGATTLLISSGSTCFTLPEGVYPGGKF